MVAFCIGTHKLSSWSYIISMVYGILKTFCESSEVAGPLAFGVQIPGSNHSSATSVSRDLGEFT